MEVFIGLSTPKLLIASIGMVIHLVSYVTQVDSGETLVVGSNDQIVEQGK